MLTESGQVRDPMDKSLVTTIKEGGWCGDQSLVKVTSLYLVLYEKRSKLKLFWQ